MLVSDKLAPHIMQIACGGKLSWLQGLVEIYGKHLRLSFTP